MSKSNSPLMTILTSNKLTGDNYVDWKRNLDIVLTVDKHKYVLNTPCPPTPADNASRAVKDQHAEWVRSDEIARCYILASVSNVLQQQHNSFVTAADMILSLSEMFADQGRQARRNAVKNFMNCRMESGTSVRDHMLVIIGHLNEMEVYGAEIDAETQVDMILETLPPSFENFKLNYSMNKLSYTLTELMKELQIAEGISGRKNKSNGDSKGKRKVMDTNYTKGKASASSSKSKKVKKAPKQSRPNKTIEKVDKSDHACHHCGKKGHWRRNCPDYLKQLKGKAVQGDKKT